MVTMASYRRCPGVVNIDCGTWALSQAKRILPDLDAVDSDQVLERINQHQGSSSVPPAGSTSQRAHRLFGCSSNPEAACRCGTHQRHEVLLGDGLPHGNEGIANLDV